MVTSPHSQKIIRGFTLIEVMVALFIMSVSTGLLLSNYPDSTVRLTLLNNNHTFALLLREAQLRGGAVDSASTAIGGYGVFIDKSVKPGQAKLFSDSADNINNIVTTNSSGLAVGDGVYNTTLSPDDTVKDTLKFKDGFTFQKLCVASSTATENIPTPKPYLCDTINGVPILTLDISFMRPSQIAHIFVNGTSSNDFPSACIELYSPKSPIPGHVRSVQVLHAGVITTSSKACD
jgi:prepilin-type N-terminal cleavage/methylation domain-containing protein